jgi:hypothetical protein
MRGVDSARKHEVPLTRRTMCNLSGLCIPWIVTMAERATGSPFLDSIHQQAVQVCLGPLVDGALTGANP